MRTSCVVAFAAIFALSGAASAAVVFYSQDFNASNGGWTPTSVGSTVPGPWTYGAYGVGGSNAWRADGGQSGGYPTPPPFEQLLTSPVITVPITGLVNLDLDHLYNFELNGGIWDGGCVMLSLNGGGFVPVPAYAVYSNGYRGKLQSDELWAMSGLDVFSGSSGSSAVPANNLGIFLHTTAQLGNFNAGDTLQLQLRGGWDWFAAFTPGWIADNVQLTHVPEPCTLTLLGLGALGLLARRRRSR